MKKRYADARHKAKKGAQPYQLREMDSVPFASRQISPAFRFFCGERVLPSLKINGYKQDQKRETAMQCCLVAIKAELADRTDAKGVGHAARGGGRGLIKKSRY